METILAIDLGKRNSVFCKLNTSSLKSEYFTAKTDPQRFHDIFIELDSKSSIVLFEVGTQAGWLCDMLRVIQLEFKVAKVNHPACQAFEPSGYPLLKSEKRAQRKRLRTSQPNDDDSLTVFA